MAGAAEKKQATRNVETLASVHKLSAIVNAIAFICVFILRRPSSGRFRLLLFTIPLAFCEWTVEKIGRPVYSTNQDGYQVLMKAGQDLQQSGLTEYMFDVIYLTLLIDVLMCVFGTMKVWWLVLAVPAYAGWKLKGVVSMILGMFLPSFRRNSAAAAAAGAADGSGEKSKRQAKLEKRAAKQQVRHR